MSHIGGTDIGPRSRRIRRRRRMAAVASVLLGSATSATLLWASGVAVMWDVPSLLSGKVPAGVLALASALAFTSLSLGVATAQIAYDTMTVADRHAEEVASRDGASEEVGSDG